MIGWLLLLIRSMTVVFLVLERGRGGQRTNLNIRSGQDCLNLDFSQGDFSELFSPNLENAEKVPPSAPSAFEYHCGQS